VHSGGDHHSGGHGGGVHPVTHSAAVAATTTTTSVVRGVGVVRGTPLAGIRRLRGTRTSCGQGSVRKRDGDIII